MRASASDRSADCVRATRVRERALGSLALRALLRESGLELGDGALVGGGRGVDRCEPALELGEAACLRREARLGAGQRRLGALGLAHRLHTGLLERRQETAELCDHRVALGEELRALACFLAEPGELFAQSRDLGTDRKQVPIGFGELRKGGRRRLRRTRNRARVTARIERDCRAFHRLHRLHYRPFSRVPQDPGARDRFCAAAHDPPACAAEPALWRGQLREPLTAARREFPARARGERDEGVRARVPHGGS